MNKAEIEAKFSRELQEGFVGWSKRWLKIKKILEDKK